MNSAAVQQESNTPRLQTLPTDQVRQVMWRFAERHDLQQLVRSTRSLARGLLAQLIADGARYTTDWTSAKNDLLTAFDQAGISTILLPPKQGGYPAGQRNQALALSAFELAWVDGGAAAGNLAIDLAVEPVVRRGTADQKQQYVGRSALAGPGEGRRTGRGAICVGEPLPDAGGATGLLRGKVTVAQWNDGKEPILRVNKRGRLTANMDFADFVVVAVESDDERIKGTCMVVLEEGDEGLFQRGEAAPKLAHQLCSTRDPVFDLRVPASRIVGGYSIKQGVIIPHYDHLTILEPVFAQSRAALAVMTAAKLLSAVEPILRYQRRRYDLQQETNQEAVHRLVDVWATGEATASLGFAAARHLDACEQLVADESTPDAEEIQRAEHLAMEYLDLSQTPLGERDEKRLAELKADKRVDYLLQQAVANVLSPAAKLWSSGPGLAAMREAVGLMGDYGLTEDCPGFLPQKWMDAQLEAASDEPVSLRRRLSSAMAGQLFVAQFRDWVFEMRRIASLRPSSGACAVASAMDLWLWALEHQQQSEGEEELQGDDRQQAVMFSLADALCWLLAARHQILDVLELASQDAQNSEPALAEYVAFFTNLCHVQSARASGEVGRICAELVFGHKIHPTWDPACEACVQADEIDALEALMPGISYGARIASDVMEADGSHAEKAGPCVHFKGLQGFVSRRSKLDGCLTGAGLAKDRAAQALKHVAIPDALDYPACGTRND